MSNVKSYFENREKMVKTVVIAALAVVIASFSALQISNALTGGGYGYGTTQPTGPSPILRSYSPAATDHFYTADAAENTAATTSFGYSAEGTGFNGYPTTGSSPAGGSPVYRSVNGAAGDHFYTASFAEYANSQKIGYQAEGVAFYNYQSINDPSTTVFVNPVYRLNATFSGDHFYTTSVAERDAAAASGYKLEGIAFYAPQ